MLLRCCLWCVNLSLLLVPVLFAQEVKTTGEVPESRLSLASLPGAIRIHVQSDQSLVCGGTTEGIFVSIDDPMSWIGIPVQFKEMPKYPGYRPVGGTKNRIFLTTQSGDDVNKSWLLVVVDVASKQSQLLRTLPRDVVAFANADIGVASVLPNLGRPNNSGELLELTLDGGKKWESIKLQKRNVHATISALAWISPSKLLVGNSQGQVRLLEVFHDKPSRQVWSAQIDSMPIRRFVLDGDFAWIFRRNPIRLDLTSGRHDGGIVVPGDHTSLYLDACHGQALVSVSKIQAREFLLAQWAAKGKDGAYHQRAMHPVEDYLFTAIPLENPRCLLIFSNGTSSLLNLEKNQLTPASLQITPFPKSENASLATREQLREMGKLIPRVPAERRSEIFKEATRKTELTPRQRQQWVIDQLKLAIENQNKSPK